MKIRLLTREELPEIKSWYEVRPGWKALNDSSYPETAFVAEHEGRLIAAGFLYISNSDWAFLEWTVTNPKENPVTRLNGLKQLITGIKELCKNDTIPGVAHIVQFITDERLEKFYSEHCGFKSTERAALMLSNVKE